MTRGPGSVLAPREYKGVRRGQRLGTMIDDTARLHRRPPVLLREEIRSRCGRSTTTTRCRSCIVSQWGMVSDPGQSKSNSRDPCRGSLTRNQMVTKMRGGEQMAHSDTHHQTTSGLQRSMQWHDRARGHGIVQGGIARPGMEPDRGCNTPVRRRGSAARPTNPGRDREVMGKGQCGRPAVHRRTPAGQPVLSAQQGRWEADGLTEGDQHILPHCGKCIC